MSRLGDLIRLERVRQKMTVRQVAKKCGMAESYLAAVEAGTKIIADEQARRILRTIGVGQHTEADFSLDEIAATVDLASVQPQMKKAATPKPVPAAEVVASTDDGEKGAAGSVWLDALSSVMHPVPVMNAVMKPIDYRLMPVQDGIIEGAKPDKVFYYIAPDDSMRGFRIQKGDRVFVVPASGAVDGAVMLVEFGAHRYLRKIKRMDDFRVILQAFDREYEAETAALNEINVLGKCVRLEADL